MDALDALKSTLDERERMTVQRPHRKLGTLKLCAKGEPSELATGRYREILNNLDSR